MSAKGTVNRRYYEIYQWLVKTIQENNGTAPTAREIVAGTAMVSTSQVNVVLRQLESVGLINMGGKGKSRAITIVGATWTPPEVLLYDKWIEFRKRQNFDDEAKP